jgi:hypothetical protein
MFICLFLGSRVTTDQRAVAKQEIQENESAKRAAGISVKPSNDCIGAFARDYESGP